MKFNFVDQGKVEKCITLNNRVYCNSSCMFTNMHTFACAVSS